MKHRIKLIHPKKQIICCLIAVAALLYGCGESQTASSSSSDSGSSAVSSEATQKAPVSSGTAASGASPVSSSPASSASSSAQSDGGYVLPAGSGSAQSGTAASSGSEILSGTDSTASPAPDAADSQPVFRSVFSSEPESGEEESEPDTSGSKISQGEYDRIQEGMTYEQVKSVIGGEGKLQSEFGQKGSELYTVTYRWSGNGISGSYAEVSFENGTVSSKIQFGLD